jgi:long-chain acyl-CoA synthetase
MLNLATLLEGSAAQSPDRTALVAGERKLTYRQLNEEANRLARALVRAGVAPGDRVALTMPNVPEFAVAYYGILKAGASVVPLNVLLKAPEISYYLKDSGARIAIAASTFADEVLGGRAEAKGCDEVWVAGGDPRAGSAAGVRALAEVVAGEETGLDSATTMPDDTAVILYTSGTTGKPKGAEPSHFNMFFNALYVTERLFRLSPDAVLLAVLPLFHSFGQTCVMNAGLCAGATVSLLPRFEPAAALAALARDRVTVFEGVPTMYWALLNHPNLPQHRDAIRERLRLCVSGGAAMAVELMARFEEIFGVTILEGYGLSETSPVATFNLSQEERKPGSIGKAIWGTEVKIFDDQDQELPAGQRGEIVVRGHNVMKGYLGRPDATAEAIRNGWFHTGDIGYRDGDGFFFIVDRKKDMILRGGFNVYPRELEEVLMTHPAVSLVAVVGVPDERLGEEIKAFIVPKAGAEASEPEIIAWCRERMAAFKIPRSVEFREAFPMTATGKILKRELRGA